MSHDVGRNDPCPCGSGKKFKKCCIDRPTGPAVEIEKDGDRWRIILRNFKDFELPWVGMCCGDSADASFTLTG